MILDQKNTAPVFTDEQNRALNARGENVLVSASAGSGKTTVMVERILRLIDEGNSLKDMLICTFTKAAASDMREKISNKLIEKSLSGDEKCEAELKLLPSARIGTIDSWCQKIVKSYFFCVGIGADFDLMDEGENHAFVHAQINELLESYLSSPAFFKLYESMESNRSDGAIRELIFKLYNFARTQENPLEWLNNCAKNYTGAEANRIIEEYLEAKKLRLTKKVAQLYAEAKAFDNIFAVEYCANFYSNLDGYEVKYPQIRKPKTASSIDFTEQLKDLRKKVKDFYEEREKIKALSDGAEMEDQAKSLAEFVIELMQKTATEKVKKAKFDYNDVEHFCVDVLKHPQSGEEIRKSNKFVFVDEYQDVNPLQDALIRSAVGGELYIVGDVKQSIYTFRMSDPDIFLSKYENGEKEGFASPMEFRKNFRSKTEILNYCNSVFQRAMTPEFGKVDYDKSALQSGKNQANGKVKMFLIKEEKCDSDAIDGVYSVKSAPACAEKTQSAMAVAVVQKIMELLYAKKEDGSLIKPSDIAVLFRAYSPVVGQIYELLKLNGIEAFVKRKAGFDEMSEIKPLLSFLKILNNRMDEISLSAFLLSPLGGMTENQLYTAIKEQKEQGFTNKLIAYSQGEGVIANKLRENFELIQRYSLLSAQLPVSQLLGSLVSEKQYFNMLLSGESGVMGASVLSQYFDYLSSLKSANTVGEYIDCVEKGAQKFEPVAPDDALSIMTVHSSKGLEFPFVFLVDCQKQFNEQELDGRYILERDLGLCLKRAKSDEDDGNNKLIFAGKLKMRKKLREEALRLLYVALTRAKDGLFMFAVDKGKEEVQPIEAVCFYDWLKPVSSTISEVVTLKYGDSEQAQPEQGLPSDKEVVNAIKKRTEFVYPHKSHVIKASVTGLAGEQELTATNVVMDNEKKSLSRDGEITSDQQKIMELGTRYHAVMENMDFSKPFDQNIALISQKLDMDGINLSHISSAYDEVCRILSDDGEIYKEQSFVYCLEDGTLVQGIIDLMLVKKDEVILLDYKLSGEKNLLKPEYISQLNLYANAVEDVLGMFVEKLYLYSFSGERIKEVPRIRK